MKTVEFLKQMIEVIKTQKDHDEFYELAEKYGFCTPWCKCSENEEICIVSPVV